MTRKTSKKKSLSVTAGIDWHDDEKPLHRGKKESKPTPTCRLATMSNLVEHLGQSVTRATRTDIEVLQTLARGEDIDIKSLEI